MVCLCLRLYLNLGKHCVVYCNSKCLMYQYLSYTWTYVLYLYLKLPLNFTCAYANQWVSLATLVFISTFSYLWARADMLPVHSPLLP
jgi:hypothetical protein